MFMVKRFLEQQDIIGFMGQRLRNLRLMLQGYIMQDLGGKKFNSFSGNLTSSVLYSRTESTPSATEGVNKFKIF